MADDEVSDSSDPRNWLLPELDEDADDLSDAEVRFQDDQPVPPPPAPPPPPPGNDSTEAVRTVGEPDDVPLRFGPDDTGPLPHWTAPPTGEVPRILGDQAPEEEEAWSTLQSGPVWRDD